MSSTAEQGSSQAASVASLSGDASSNVQTVAAATEELSASISEISRQVAESSSIAGAAASEADRTNTEVQALADAAQRIGDVVALITGIAEQTNLLALNAAIEAARAGEQGRGFAVVADEVRKLSEKTAGSTNEIASMIEAIARGTAEAVGTMERGVAKVGDGVALAREAGDSITRIEDGSSRLLLAVNEISGALKEQSQASNDIARHVERIAQMTEENSIAVKETAHASHSLEQLAGSLQTSVGRFRL
jgi:methyl-accepting chemotaxis protein